VWLLAIGLLVLFTVPLLYPNSIADKSANAAFAAIRQGATEQDVDAILGNSSGVSGLAHGGKSVFWNMPTSHNGAVGITVTFDAEGRVVSKAMQDEPRPCSAIHRLWRRSRQPVK
jgi:hypothetical protein